MRIPTIVLNLLGIAAIVLLCFALLFDFGRLTVAGLFTADTYYLPLAEVVPEENVSRMEDMVIDIHTGIMQRQGAIFGTIHGIALIVVVLLLIGINRNRQLAK